MAGSGDEDEDGGGPLTPHTKGIIQHFKKQVREYTKEIDTDLQVVNEKVGVLEGGPISTNSKLVGLEAPVGALISSTRRRIISIEGVDKRMRTAQKIQVLIMLLTPKLRMEVSDVYAKTIEAWVDSVHVRYITMTMLSVRLNLR